MKCRAGSCRLAGGVRLRIGRVVARGDLGRNSRGVKRNDKRVVTVGLVQMRCAVDPGVNLAAAVKHVRAAAKRGAEIVCLPELFRSRYFCQSEDHANFALAETIPGPSTTKLGKLARELGIVIVASLFERRAAGVYHNTVVVLGATGAVIGTYRKMHVPDDPLFHEKFYFAPGDLGFRAFDVGAARVGTLICWDQWYPEAARLTALAGAEVLFYPTAIGWHPSEKKEHGEAQHTAWETVQRGHAIANGVFVAVPNRVGHEPHPGGDGLEFWGQSFLVDPAGRILARARADREEILVVPCDLGAIETARTHWPFLRDRRIDAYGDITRRYAD
ncbi:MAG: carbon-nitrogen hydrolase [Deltaproteobacteria bacterium]|nr:carbon-nitrogen hydrolase [Deltaproteobacteria bacterium]